MQRVLGTLIRHHSVVRGMVTLLRDGELHAEAVEGFEDRARNTQIKVGEGITGKVVESGKPIVVPRVSKEPAFLNLASRRPDHLKQELSFICVPIVLNRQPVGALGVDLRFKPERDYDSSVKFLGVVSSMIAQALNVQRMVEEERRRLLDENTHLRQELRERYDFSNIIGTSGPTRQMYEQVAQVAQTNTTVLIRGESGTGKELIAHAIHYNSLRAKKPFIKVSCAALPDTLIESELFGYEKGAFTGAAARKKGRFEMAEGGTLFLDEIGDVNLGTQVKLLRVLQEREFERVGGTETVKANVRLIAATNKDMEKAIAEGTFREDLYYRLNVFTIFVPPLRERKADLLLLADHFLDKFSREHNKVIKRISTPAIDMLTAYHWPGNVRELENALERAVLVCDGAVVHGHHLPPSLQTADSSGTVTRVSLKDAVAAYERDLILDALKTTRGNRAKAARLLDTTERILNYKVQGYGIDVRRFKSSEVGPPCRPATARRPRPPGISSGNIAAVTRHAALGRGRMRRGRDRGAARAAARRGRRSPRSCCCRRRRRASRPARRRRRLRHAHPARPEHRRLEAGRRPPRRGVRVHRHHAAAAGAGSSSWRRSSRRCRSPARRAEGALAGPAAAHARSRRTPPLPAPRSRCARRSAPTPSCPRRCRHRRAPPPPAARRHRRRRPAAPAPLRRFYIAVAFSDRGRPGPPSVPVELPLTAVPDAPFGLEVEYTADDVTVSWEPAGGLLGFLLDNRAAARDAVRGRTRRRSADPAALPPGPTRYHVYRDAGAGSAGAAAADAARARRHGRGAAAAHARAGRRVDIHRCGRVRSRAVL